MTSLDTRTMLYKDAAGEWRWRRLAANNRIVGAATEGYKNKQDCITNAKLNGCTNILEDVLQ